MCFGITICKLDGSRNFSISGVYPRPNQIYSRYFISEVLRRGFEALRTLTQHIFWASKFWGIYKIINECELKFKIWIWA